MTTRVATHDCADEVKRWGVGDTSTVRHRLADLAFSLRYLLRHHRDLRAAGLRWDELLLLLRVSRYTQVPPLALAELLRCLERVDREGVRGDLVELGAWRGGTGALLCHAAAARRRKVWLFDSFVGMPEAHPEDRSPEADVLARRRYGARLAPVGTNVAPVHIIRYLLGEKLSFHDVPIQIVEGWIQQTVPPIKSQLAPIALLRLDCDFYAATLFGLEQLYPAVAPGGIVVIDDYDVFSGCRRAVDKYFAGGSPALHPIPARSGVWLQKPGRASPRSASPPRSPP